MKKFIVLTPEQFAKLQKGAERVLGEESEREKSLSNLVSRLKTTVKPEDFDKFQNLFHRFIADQKSLRQSIQLPIESSSAPDHETESSAPVDGGLSFHFGSENDEDQYFVRKGAVKKQARTTREEEAPSSYTSFASRKRRLPNSTPDTRKKKKKIDVTPNFSTSPNLKTRSKLQWDVRPLK